MIFSLTSKATLLLALLCAVFCLIYRAATRETRYDKTRNEERMDEKS